MDITNLDPDSVDRLRRSSILRRDMSYDARGKRTHGISLRAAAKESGISIATLSRIENGGACDLATFKKLCQWTGKSADWLLGL